MSFFWQGTLYHKVQWIKSMKIFLAEHFGMCFGVRDAIAQAEALAAAGPLTILGELVHNPLVRERLRARGVHESSLDGANVISARK